MSVTVIKLPVFAKPTTVLPLKLVPKVGKFRATVFGFCKMLCVPAGNGSIKLTSQPAAKFAEFAAHIRPVVELDL